MHERIAAPAEKQPLVFIPEAMKSGGSASFSCRHQLVASSRRRGRPPPSSPSETGQGPDAGAAGGRGDLNIKGAPRQPTNS